MKIRLTLAAALLCISSAISYGQFWHVMPPLDKDNSINVCYANDDKRIFYLGKDDGGVKNIFAIDVKTLAVTQVTKFSDAPVVRFVGVPGKPFLIYMRASAAHPTDYHLYKIDNNGVTVPEDLTPTGDGIANTIVGAQYNGRYIYYSSNKTNPAKMDFYRYDVAQNISELVFANDKNYSLHAWSRDQKHVLMSDAAGSKLFISDVETTERFPLYSAPQAHSIAAAMWTPDNKQLLVLESDGTTNELKVMDMTTPESVSPTTKTLDTGAVTMIGASINGRCFYERKGDVLAVNDYQGQNITMLPNGIDVTTNAKETMMLQVQHGADGVKLRIYDMTKKAGAEPIIIKNY
ncbi:MAG: hypothetical protein JSS75_13195 [Bacteroidetes bacterium]|nr:hypothetical protein [Bacteroidota bacterium]